MELFPLCDGDLEEIHRLHNTNREEIDQSLRTLQEWFEEQTYMPDEVQSDGFFENMLAKCKYDVEKTKRKVESQFRLKSGSNDFFTMFGTDSFVLPTQNTVILMPMPKLGPHKERIFISCLKTSDIHNFSFDSCMQAVMSIVELSIHHDKSNRLRLVADCSNTTFEIVRKLNLFKLHRLAKLVIHGYASKIIAIDLFAVNGSMQMLIALAKKLMKFKVFERIIIHKDRDSLFQSIPQEYLPIEFGGVQGSIEELLAQADISMRQNRQFLVESADYAARVDKTTEASYFGFGHALRKLNIM